MELASFLFQARPTFRWPVETGAASATSNSRFERPQLRPRLCRGYLLRLSARGPALPTLGPANWPRSGTNNGRAANLVARGSPRPTTDLDPRLLPRAQKSGVCAVGIAASVPKKVGFSMGRQAAQVTPAPRRPQTTRGGCVTLTSR